MRNVRPIVHRMDETWLTINSGLDTIIISILWNVITRQWPAYAASHWLSAPSLSLGLARAWWMLRRTAPEDRMVDLGTGSSAPKVMDSQTRREGNRGLA